MTGRLKRTLCLVKGVGVPGSGTREAQGFFMMPPSAATVIDRAAINAKAT